MSTPTVERTGDWDSVSFAGGYAGLHDLADDEFSGTVTAGPARLFMLRGSVIGILDGDIEDFEEAGGTAREAPHPALPLLAVMQERSDEVRAEYYTEETPISEVDRTLSDGNFTGYVELSENVLSGDYYQVYHQGHSMSVAYVGASERLIEDDEAFEQADDEVGIYEVRPVDIEVVEIPEPADEESASAGTADSGAAGAAAGGASAATAVDEDAATETGETAADSDAEMVEAEEESDEAGAATADAAEESSEDASASAADDEADADTAAPTASADEVGEAGSSAGAPETDAAESSDDVDSTTADDAAGEASASGAASTESGGESAGGGTSGERSAAETTPTESETAGARSGQEGDAGIPDAPGGNRSAGGTRQGEPAPDHPAAVSRDTSGQQSEAAGGDGAGGALAPGDLEMRSLPSLDPERSASANKQERARRSASGGSAAAAGAGAAGGAAGAAADGTQEPVESGPADAEAGTAPDPTAAHAEADDPKASHTADEPAGSSAEPSPDAATAENETSDGATTDDGPAAGDDAASDSAAAEGAAAAGGTAAEADLEGAEAEVERLESELADLREEHENVAGERDRLESELAEARDEIERLRDRLEGASGQVGEAATTLSPREAIDETNLFIRYDSKGEATLEKAHAGEVDKAAVDDNLRLEYHTSFDADDAAVDGVDFDKFLTGTVQYRFVDWLVRTLLYEIRDTGNTGAMADLYDALPKVDRAELNGQVTVKYTEDDQENRSQLGFDVIVRDRMGNPLIVANLNDSRDPATESMMTDLVRSAERVGETSASLAGGFLVTRSFFEPEALETAEEATAGGLLSRGKQKSFVNLSRKGGYHLCLVEARNEEFHLAVPEL